MVTHAPEKRTGLAVVYGNLECAVLPREQPSAVARKHNSVRTFSIPAIRD